tara:strand:+ start:11404 stop:12126 length:723 start_codon:yes stop_codon:yes gene_type:complete
VIKRYVREMFVEHGILIGDVHKNCRHGALHKAWGHVFTNHLRGEYVEFGVYHGGSFLESYAQFKKFKSWLSVQTKHEEEWRRKVASSYVDYRPEFIGLDSFEGMPENDEDNHTFSKGTFLSSYDSVESKCRSSFSDGLAGYQLIKGYFENVDPSIFKNKIAILNIDSDLYESCAVALKLAKPQMQQGMVLLMDDYNAYNASNDQGERRALKEFSTETGYVFEKWFSYHYSGQAFLLTTKL